MNKYIKITCIFFLMLFSFYYTEKVALYVQNSTPLKKKINDFKKTSYVSSIDAKINDIYIVPGLNGIKVNTYKSYKKMKADNVFDENEIIYDEKKPSVSIDDYPEKIINKGNQEKNAISIIISEKNNNLSFIKKNDIPFTFVNSNEYCIILEVDDKCGSKRKVKPTYVLNNTNFLFYITNISRGDIIYIDDNLDSRSFNVLLEKIRFYDINLMNLNNHLSERI